MTGQMAGISQDRGDILVTLEDDQWTPEHPALTLSVWFRQDDKPGSSCSLIAPP
jgi:hypothetical protein